jgi:hypothetical protein
LAKRFHPHPAFGHLLPEGEGIKQDALGPAQGGQKGIPNVEQGMSKSQVGRSETRQHLGVRVLCAASGQTRKPATALKLFLHFTLGRS